MLACLVPCPAGHSSTADTNAGPGVCPAPSPRSPLLSPGGPSSQVTTREALLQCPLPPELQFSSSLSCNRLTQEAALDLVDVLPACLRMREASVR